MKSPARSPLTARARAGRLILLVAVLAAWVIVVLAVFPRGDTAAAGSDTNRSTPDERTPHYAFPTYA